MSASLLSSKSISGCFSVFGRINTCQNTAGHQRRSRPSKGDHSVKNRASLQISEGRSAGSESALFGGFHKWKEEKRTGEVKRREAGAKSFRSGSFWVGPKAAGLADDQL